MRSSAKRHTHFCSPLDFCLTGTTPWVQQANPVPGVVGPCVGPCVCLLGLSRLRIGSEDDRAPTHPPTPPHPTPCPPGDVKPENVMVTSWNWVFLTDFASFKPTFLPADNDVSLLFYYFEPVKNRSRCCLAPERFVRLQVGVMLQCMCCPDSSQSTGPWARGRATGCP